MKTITDHHRKSKKHKGNSKWINKNKITTAIGKFQDNKKKTAVVFRFCFSSFIFVVVFSYLLSRFATQSHQRASRMHISTPTHTHTRVLSKVILVHLWHSPRHSPISDPRRRSLNSPFATLPLWLPACLAHQGSFISASPSSLLIAAQFKKNFFFLLQVPGKNGSYGPD